MWPSGSVKLAVRTPHSPVDRAVERAPRRDEPSSVKTSASVSSTQIVSWKLEPLAGPSATAAGLVKPVGRPGGEQVDDRVLELECRGVLILVDR